MTGQTHPAVYTIDPSEAFVDALAKGILHHVGDSPEALARVRVLLPTRRACRSLREAFLRLSRGRPMLLPQMTPLGDVDEDDLWLERADEGDALDLPPAIGSLARQTILAHYVLKMSPDETPEQAVRLAGELAKLVDQVHTEGLDLAALPTLVEDQDLSEHWQKTVTFLSIVGKTWPDVLVQMGALDPAKRRDLLLRARAQAWRDAPPTTPVIAAGSTGSIPATAELLDVIANLPQGQVVLPGLDTLAPDAVWQNLDPSHPQYGMAQLLGKLAIDRRDVQPWPSSDVEANSTPPARRALLDLALVPAQATDLWRKADIPPSALDDITLIECDGPREEAETIALILRDALNDPQDHPGRTAALITPDRQLARRVAVEMRRWGVEVDDSAGLPLDQTQPGAFFNLVADMALEHFHPVATLSCLKYPLAAGGISPYAMRQSARALEAACLRGTRPDDGLQGLEDRLRTFIRDAYAHKQFHRAGFDEAQVMQALRILQDTAQPLCEALTSDDRVAAQDLLKIHVEAAERLAATDDANTERRLWAGDAGETLSTFIAEAHDALADFPPIQPDQYPALIRALMVGRPVRPRFARHPRVFIWGLLEARLQRADVTVLGGLNEGTWPSEPAPSPWMSRPMAKRFGLPLPERRVGLAAHDFVQAAASGRVFITRAKRQGTSPQVPSRWLTRINTLLGDAALKPEPSWPEWARQLTRWDGPVETCSPPKPTPPVSARPSRLSVTRIETWIRDPYSIYARYILDLQPLDDIDADASAANKGNVIHEVLDRFISRHMNTLPDDPLQTLLDIGEVVFREEISSPAVRAFWWPRFRRIAEWFVDFETKRRLAGYAPAVVEGKGTVTLDGFTLSAKADRIDRTPTGGAEIIDYKTGQPPTKAQVESGLAPQLPLEGLIIQHGGFDAIDRVTPVDSLLYVRLSGGRVAGEEKPLKIDTETVIEDTHVNLLSMILKYADADMPYLSRPRAQFDSRYGDFDHLARVKEWRDGSNEGDGE